ncbi:hypothetical protein A6X21_15290 [Planctopirus hydrillae]|uniref:Uncharacterized protein n=1 Tax=Planctopirus hydrillae TaxID=1841610 RepID=A0A1C3ETP4_9PLAN|nr:hypothetical protein A6X21_15290 [Planctopirus hydrillae]
MFAIQTVRKLSLDLLLSASMCFQLLTINNIRKAGMLALSYGRRKMSGTSAFGFCHKHDFDWSLAAFL